MSAVSVLYAVVIVGLAIYASIAPPVLAIELSVCAWRVGSELRRRPR